MTRDDVIVTLFFRVAKEYAPAMVAEIQREYVEAGGSATSLSVRVFELTFGIRESDFEFLATLIKSPENSATSRR